jgi:hypothetical protein
MDSDILPTIAGIGMTFAGFAGLIAALRPASGEWRPVDVHMIQATIVSGLGVVLLSLIPIPLAEMFGEQPVLRVAAAVLTAFFVVIAVRQSRSGREIVPRGDRRGLAFGVVAVVAVVVMPAAIYTGTIEWYELALIVMLLVPVIVFSLVLRDLGKSR